MPRYLTGLAGDRFLVASAEMWRRETVPLRLQTETSLTRIAIIDPVRRLCLQARLILLVDGVTGLAEGQRTCQNLLMGGRALRLPQPGTKLVGDRVLLALLVSAFLGVTSLQQHWCLAEE